MSSGSGSTVGGILGGIAGAVIGFFAGGNVALGWAIGSTLGGIAGGILDPTVVQQPGLNDKKLQSSQYGTMLGLVWGRFRTAGSVTWIGNNGELVEHAQSSGGKGGGAQVETKSYTGSWQITFNKSTRKGQPALVAIDKWWADGRVVDVDDINPTVYTGWALQLPDSSMEADLGVGEVPAERFKGTAVFNEVQMEQFYNRLPQLEALLRTKGTSNGDLTQVAANSNTEWPSLMRVSAWSTNWASDETLPDPTAFDNVPTVRYEDDGGVHSISKVGTYVFTNGSTIDLWYSSESSFAPTGGASGLVRPGLSASESQTAPGRDFLSDAGVEDGRYCLGVSLSTDGRTVIAITADTLDLSSDTICDKWHRIINGQLDAEGTIGQMGDQTVPGLGLRGFGISNAAGNAVIGGNAQPAVGGGSPTCNSLENNGQYIWQYKVNSGFVNKPTDPNNNPLCVRLLYIDDSGVIQQYFVTGATPPPSANDAYWNSFGGPSQVGVGSCYVTEEGYFGTICTSGLSPDPQTALYTRLGPTSVLTLAEILGDVFELQPSSVGDVALTPDRYDVSAAEAVLVHGANFGSQMQKRNFVAMTQAAYNFDIVESDDGESAFLKVVFRGGDPVATIPDEDLGVHEEGEGAKPLLELVARIQDWELPGRVNVQHYDFDQDYQIGSQFAQKAGPYVDNVTRIDLPIVMSASEARNIAKRELHRAHLERDSYAWSTSRKWAHLEPTDVVTIQGRDLRILKKTETPTGIIRFEGVLSAPYIANQSDDGAPAEGTTPNPPKGPGVATKLLLLDVPLRNDEQSDYAILAAMGPAESGSWRGASLQVSVDGGSNYIEIATTDSASVIGETTTALTAWTGGYVIDYVGCALVAMDDGAELVSMDDVGLYNGANLCLIGNEVLQFGTAELVADGVYRISKLLRGRKGTEQAAVGHGVGERFVMLATCVAVPLSAADLGVERLYKAVTYGKPLASGTPQPFTNSGVALRCYAPGNVNGGAFGNGDVRVDWTRRTRRDGEWRDFVDAGLGETTERYVVEIWNETFTLCARVESVTTPTFLYTAAMQTTDFGETQERVFGKVAQIGVIGPGMLQRFDIQGGGSAITDEPLNPTDPSFNFPEYPTPPTPSGPSPTPDIIITTDNNNYPTTTFTIGQRLLIKFHTRTSPAVTIGRIGIAEYGDPPYFRTARLSTDAKGLMVVEESAGTAVLFNGLTLTANTDYYLTLETAYGFGNPSGTIGAPCDVIIYLSDIL